MISPNVTNTPTQNIERVKSESGTIKSEDAEEVSIMDRIALARGRYANRNLSEQGDLAMLEAHYSEAEKYYAAARIKTPNDPILLEKYISSLYNLKKYDDVIDIFDSNITSLTGQTKMMFLRSYTRSEKIKDENIIKSLPLSNDERNYIRIVRSCLT